MKSMFDDEKADNNHELYRELYAVVTAIKDPYLRAIAFRAIEGAASNKNRPIEGALKEAGNCIVALIIADLLRKAQKPGA